MKNENLVVPEHVPAHLVYDFDFFQGPQFNACPHASVKNELHADAPEIFYTPRNGGHWVVTRMQAALEVLQNSSIFSNLPEFNYAKNHKPRTLPLQADPPHHTALRQALNRYFTPAALQGKDPEIRELVQEIIAEIKPLGRCEFVSEVADRFPVTIFLRMANAPVEDRHKLVPMVNQFARGATAELRLAGLAMLGEYLKVLLDERRQAPGEDLLSRVIEADIGGRPPTAEEELGLATLLFLGGLDTTKSVLSFIMTDLAQNPDNYRRLRENPEMTKNYAEELMRTHGVSVPERGVRHDAVFRDIEFRQNDRVILLTPLYGLDDNMVSNPLCVDFDRDVSPHLTFGGGVHRCLGSNLARAEIRIFLAEWAQAFPEISVAEGFQIESHGGTVWSPKALELRWPVP